MVRPEALIAIFSADFAVHFSPEGRLLEEEYEPSVVTYHGDEKDTWDGVMFCSQECCDKRKKFLSPEEYGDE